MGNPGHSTCKRRLICGSSHERRSGQLSAEFFQAENVALGIRISNTTSTLKGPTYKGEIQFGLSLTRTMIKVARDKIENLSALIYNIVTMLIKTQVR